jgi:hypothetical protein
MDTKNMKRISRKMVSLALALTLLSVIWLVSIGQGNVALAYQFVSDNGGYRVPPKVLMNLTTNSNSSSANFVAPADSSGISSAYFTDYGHIVPNPLLHYWRANGRFETFGGPLSASFVDSDGHLVQYFQKATLAYYPELAAVKPYQLGKAYLAAQPAEIEAAAPFAKVPALAATTKNQKYFPKTGHKVSFGLLNFFNSSGGLTTWGNPISEEYDFTANDGSTYIAQLFEQGRMLWSQSTGAIIDQTLSSEVAQLNGVSFEPESNFDPLTGKTLAPVYSTSLWAHWVDVSLSKQSETFYEGDIPVRTSLVTTGTATHPTPVGRWHIFRLVPNEHMKNGKPGDVDYYDLKNVLYTMYFTADGDALHYAWWRSVFGETGSHGCVNEDYDTSLFAWNFLGIGSLVNVHI